MNQSRKIIKAAKAGDIQCNDISLSGETIEIKIGCKCNRLINLVRELERIGLRLPSYNPNKIMSVRQSLITYLGQIGFHIQPGIEKELVFSASVASLRGD
jgi:hypothetical protein